MAQGELILDYASRRKRSAFRLASRSALADAWSDEGEMYVVREWLAGQSQTLAVIIIVAIMLAMAGWNTIDLWRQRTPVGWLIFLYALMAGGLALIPVVVQESWRQTVLLVWDGTLRLTMGGPLRSREWVWDAADVDSVRAIMTQNQPDAPLLAEIEVLARGAPPIRLFTDHPESELSRIAAEIGRALRRRAPHAP